MVDFKLEEKVYRHWQTAENGDRYGGGQHTIIRLYHKADVGYDLESIPYNLLDTGYVVVLKSKDGEVIKSNCTELSPI